MNISDFKVCVKCSTYNHSKYITDAMDGFCMQITDFPFVCLIVDDCSTDGEPVVINSYIDKYFNVIECPIRNLKDMSEHAEVVFARNIKNPNCYFAVYFLTYNHYSIKKSKLNYLKEWRDNISLEALCEGDDYWTSANKLQIQVDFLEQHPDYSMCFTNSIVHYEQGYPKDHEFAEIESRDYNGLELFNKWIVPTGTVVLKTSIYESDMYRILSSDKRIIYSDLLLFLSCASIGNVFGLGETTGVYRRHLGSLVFMRNSNMMYKELQMIKAYNELLPKIYFSSTKKRIVSLSIRGFYKATAEKNLFNIKNFLHEAFRTDSLFACACLVTIPFLRIFKKRGSM